jgi:hypothetical protein
VKCEEIGDSGAHRMESPRALLHFTSDVGLPFPSVVSVSLYPGSRNFDLFHRDATSGEQNSNQLSPAETLSLRELILKKR